MSYSPLLNRAVPRAVVGSRVSANSTPQDMLVQLSGAFDDFKRRQSGRLENVEASIDGFQGCLLYTSDAADE